jgi:hypothetical protein
MDEPPEEVWDTDIPIVTVAKVLKGQFLDFHPTLFQETQAAFGREPLGDIWPQEDAVLFSIQRKPTDPKHKKNPRFRRRVQTGRPNAPHPCGRN